ncbi:3-deoxy-manno-octulosonate cytidylyltransferase [Psychrobium sp. 1_MG-2023]|uniref:3-deoxy-manno-octulosonate cytidylyltransferase n=1 Tax=Psychrobium sp. 1_MG-2023 TaxID=3062624 RepID=UPI000C34648C|nr:3-deoxy-manno-octulosonate cytidylyltransferase [Psychrobium sp. 1_MG-2023]MDP2560279.1 3-deoxy-manno-octulosonate cytidylyltransferase [Psychrobium sp. 1_MG-2023]PKF55396.1 3-deoxy-manno-octulosonate cytidylyltransferase [Alteromonadales bacterium alter-6D02]
MSFSVIIPARYQSSRLPGKPLLDIGGKPMIQWVYERAMSSGANKVVVATDDQRIADVVAGFGGTFCMTGTDHESGTERLGEVIDLLGLDSDEIVVNVQGDEPMIPSENIAQVAALLSEKATIPMATLAVPIDDNLDIDNPNAVKVVCDKNSCALYFSRAAIPFDRDGFHRGSRDLLAQNYFRHIGIYAYRAGFIRQYLTMEPSPLEQIESLEQLRVLYHGEKIAVGIAHQSPPAGVDTQADLERIRMHFN